MATLYTQASKNVARTWFLMGLFFIFIIILGWFFAQVLNNPGILYFAVIFSLLMNVISFWNSDKIIMALSHAKEVKHEDMPKLYHIVENLCITAGLPVPKIYIIDELAPNAFATGRDPKHAALAVTRGLLEKLNRTELEGVIAHELSHVGNRDTLLMTVIVVLVGLISILSHYFLRVSFFGGGRRNDRDGGEIGVVLVIIGIVLAIISPIVAMIIQMAISRKREFLADADGALLTRYPEGLASALEKISSDKTPLPVVSPATAHLYITNPLKNKISGMAKLFTTHPPIEERIKALRDMSI